MTEIDAKIEHYVEMMQIKDRQIVTPSEADARASAFLVACAHVTNWRATYSDLLIAAQAEQSVAYKLSILQAGGRNITEAKVIAEADPAYQSVSKRVSELENKVDYFRAYYEIFNNAHIFYRQQSAQIHKEIRY